MVAGPGVRWTGLWIAVACVVAAFAVDPARGQSAPAAQDDVETAVKASLRRVSASTGILVDPGLGDELVSNARIFSGNLCDAGGEGENCARTLGSPATLDAIMQKVLADLASRSAQVTSLAQRLSGTVGVDIAAAGWPDTMENRAAVVLLPPALKGASLALRTGAGPQALGKGGRLILLVPGQATLVARAADGRESTYEVRAQLRQVASLQARAAGAASVGRLAVPKLFCRFVGIPKYAGPYVMFNWGRANMVESAEQRSANLRPFVAQKALDIRIVQDDSANCGEECVLTLGMSFARAMALWRTGCARCAGNTLVTIKVGAHSWIDARAADRLRRVASGSLAAPMLDLSKAIPAELQATRVEFEELTGDQALMRSLCAASPSAAPWIGAARDLVCPGGSGRAGPLRPILALRISATGCGPAADFLACGIPGGIVELALEGTRYRFESPRGTFMLGSADGLDVDGQAVIAHEVGHWFGVPHSEVAGGDAILDLMSETLDPKRECLSQSTLVMMNNAADLRWSFGVSGKQGLRRPRPVGDR